MTFIVNTGNPQLDQQEISRYQQHYRSQGLEVHAQPLPTGGYQLTVYQAQASATQQPQYAAPAQQPQYAAPAQQPQYAAPAQQPQYAAPAQQPQYAAPAQQPQYGAPNPQ